MNGKKSFLIESLVNDRAAPEMKTEPRTQAPAFLLAFAPVATPDDLAFALADVDALPIDSPDPAHAAPYDAHSDDLTSFVGLDVGDSAMAVLTGRALAYGWQLEARRVKAGWHVSKLTAKP